MSASVSIEKLEQLIAKVKLDLDGARKRGDKLAVALLENALNDLLDNYNYHTYHTSQMGAQR